MVDVEKQLRRRAAGIERLESMVADKSVWARTIADAVLDLFRRQTTITADELRDAIRANVKVPIEIMGTDMSIDLSRKASEVAIKHLDDALRASERDVKE